MTEQPAEGGNSTGWGRQVRWALALILLAALAASAWPRWDDLRDQALAFRWGWCALSLGLLLIANVVGAECWRRWITGLGYPLSPVDAFRIVFQVNLAKYIPGPYWHYIGRAALLAPLGVPAEATIASAAVDIGVGLVTAALVGVPLLLAGGGALDTPRTVAFLAGAVGGLAILHPHLLEAGLSVASRLLSRPPVRVPYTYGYVLRTCVAYFLYWALLIAAFVAFAQAWTPSPLGASQALALAGAWPLSWALGIMAIGAPAGLGVRELGLAALLAPAFPAGWPAVVALASRLWFMGAELLLFLAAIALTPPRRSASPETPPLSASAPFNQPAMPPPLPAVAPGRLRLSDWRTAGLLVVALTALYFLTAGGHFYAYDDQQKFDALHTWLTTGSFAIQDGWAKGVGGQRYSWFPLGSSVLMLPGYLAGSVAGLFAPQAMPASELARVAISFQNTVVSAMLAASVFLAARLAGFRGRAALGTALLLGLGTMAWPYAKTAWSEPTSTWLLFLGLLAVWRADARDGKADTALWLAAGTAFGGAWLIRQELVLVAVAAGGWLAWRRRQTPAALIRPVLLVGGPLLVALAATLWYEWVRYGVLLNLPNYTLPQKQTPLADRFGFFLVNVYRYVLSPNQGAFWFSPAAILGILGMRGFYKRQPALATLLGTAMLPLLLFYMVGWGASTWAWGVRYVYTFLPFLMLPAVALLDRPFRRGLVVGLAGLGIGVQLLAIPYDLDYLYLREIGRVPGSLIADIMLDPARGPLVLASQDLSQTVAAGGRALISPPQALPIGDALRQARRDMVPDFWWLLYWTVPVPRVGIILVAAVASALGALALAALIGGPNRRTPPGGPGPGTLALFGTYDPRLPRTRMLVAGWKAAGGAVLEINEPIWPEAGTRAATAAALGHLGISPWRWLAAQARLWQRRSELSAADVVLVPYPGYLDMPIARLVTDDLERPLIFDPFVSIYDTVVGDRALADPGSLRAQVCLAADRIALRLADRVLADTAPHGAFFVELAGLAPGTIAVVPVGADDTLFAPRPAAEHDGIEVLFYGRTVPLHGVETIVAAALQLTDVPGLKLRLVGRGQIEVAALIEMTGATNVSWTPDVPYESLPGLIAGADIVLGVFGSTDKAARVVPHKVYEPAAMGKAMITRSGEAIQAAFGPDAIVTVPPGAPGALADAIRRLAADPAARARLGAAARARHAAAFGSAGVGRALVAALAGLPADDAEVWVAARSLGS